MFWSLRVLHQKFCWHFRGKWCLILGTHLEGRIGRTVSYCYSSWLSSGASWPNNNEDLLEISFIITEISVLDPILRLFCQCFTALVQCLHIIAALISYPSKRATRISSCAKIPYATRVQKFTQMALTCHSSLKF